MDSAIECATSAGGLDRDSRSGPRPFCDDATKLIKSTIGDSLNAKLIGTLYAGGVEKVGLDRYLARAHKLGQKLAK